ncbi:hypothetical protein [Nocardia sp. NPDC051463]|uniref:hypothetical protein n=1 Tax=Nocardia sp. NPDC051463 TaxID=3154845 RepID=UPI003450FB1F
MAGMIGPGRVLRGIADKLRIDLPLAARTAADRHSGESVRKLVVHVTSGDQRMGREIYEGNVLDTNDRHSFTIGDVRSVPLSDAHGNPIGVVFPSLDDNPVEHVHWARAEPRFSDRGYSAEEPALTVDPVTGRQRWGFDNLRAAPWDEGDGRVPTYVFAHGDEFGHVAVEAHGKTVLVDGANFGRILASNEHYLAAVNGGSGGSTVSVICFGDSAAEGLTKSLWAAGIDTKVYTFKTLVGYRTAMWTDGAVSSGMTITARNAVEEELLKDPIGRYEPPRPTGDVGD